MYTLQYTIDDTSPLLTYEPADAWVRAGLEADQGGQYVFGLLSVFNWTHCQC